MSNPFTFAPTCLNFRFYTVKLRHSIHAFKRYFMNINIHAEYLNLFLQKILKKAQVRLFLSFLDLF